jgi:predicted anti-sigma-YlaC factor YlaD
MKQGHVIKYFQAFTEGRTGEKERLKVEEHLDDCKRCRKYFRKMALLLEKPDLSYLPHLQADPFLPARIKALAENHSRARARRIRFAWRRLSLAGLALAAAVTIGVFLGKGLSAASGEYGDTEILSAYYNAFSQKGLVDDWEYIVETGKNEL